jgi:hypothetical protein
VKRKGDSKRTTHARTHALGHAHTALRCMRVGARAHTHTSVCQRRYARVRVRVRVRAGTRVFTHVPPPLSAYDEGSALFCRVVKRKEGKERMERKERVRGVKRDERQAA